MAFVVPNIVQETTTTTGTGTVTLGGPVAGFLDFDSQCSNGDVVPYTIENATQKETGIGQFLTGPDRIARTAILYSTNGGSAVDFSAGTKNVFSALAGELLATLIDPTALTGMLARTAARTYTPRTITAGHGISIADGDGVLGNPTIQVVSALDYGVLANGSTDDTAAWQDAVDDGPNRLILLPEGMAGSSIITSTVTIGETGIYIGTRSPNAATVQFQPTADDVCFHFVHPTSGVLFFGGVKNLAFYSTDTSWAKTAILLEDTAIFLLENLSSQGWTDSGYDSTFLHTKGREFLITRNLSIAADMGILFDVNPNVALGSQLHADHFHLTDTFITVTSGSNKPCIRVASGVNLSNCTFDGANPWVRPGSHGFEWDDSTSTGSSFNVQFSGVRVEQAQDSSKYSFYLNRAGASSQLQQVNFFNCFLDSAMNGLYMRHINRVQFFGCTSAATAYVALNADSTCDDIKWSNMLWSAGSTVTTTGLLQLSGTKKLNATSPLPETGHLIVAPAADYLQQPMQLYSGKQWAWSGQIANGGFQQFPFTGSANTVGIISVYAYSSSGPIREGGVAGVDGSGAAPVILAGSTNFDSVVAGGTPAASKLTVYATSSIFRVHNTLGQTVDVVITFDYKSS